MRLFTFGCSFTGFLWPTWADIIATDLNLEFYNYGYPGLGNQGIASRIVEADFKHKMTKDDMMLILWSTWSREDRYMGSNWVTGGSVFNNTLYDKAFIDKYWSWENDVVKNSTAIHMTSNAYKDLISYQGSMSGFPGPNHDKAILLHRMINKILDLDDPHTKFYRDNLELPPVWNLSKIKNSQFSGNCSDTHPDVLHHLSYVENNVYPSLNLTLKDSTKEMFTSIQNDLTMAFEYKDDVEALRRKAAGIIAKYNIKKSSI